MILQRLPLTLLWWLCRIVGTALACVLYLLLPCFAHQIATALSRQGASSSTASTPLARQRPAFLSVCAAFAIVATAATWAVFYVVAGAAALPFVVVGGTVALVCSPCIYVCVIYLHCYDSS